jgi:hypothetical protein
MPYTDEKSESAPNRSHFIIAVTSGIEPVLMYAATSRATFGPMSGRATASVYERSFFGCASIDVQWQKIKTRGKYIPLIAAMARM